MNKDCKSCYWYHQCGENQTCQDYTPLYDETNSEVITSGESEYENDLMERSQEYDELLKELGE